MEEALDGVDVFGAQTTVKAFVAVVLKDGVVDGCLYPRLLRGCGQGFVVLDQFVANGEAAVVF